MEYKKAVSFKLKEYEYEILEENVRKSGKNRSDFIRNRILGNGDTNGDTGNTNGDIKFLMDFFQEFKQLFTTDKNAIAFMKKNRNSFIQIAQNLGGK